MADLSTALMGIGAAFQGQAPQFLQQQQQRQAQERAQMLQNEDIAEKRKLTLFKDAALMRANPEMIGSILADRKAGLQRFRDMNIPIDTRHTDQMLALYESGDMAGLNKLLDNTVQAGVATGVLPKPEAPEAYTLAEGARRFVGGREIASNIPLTEQGYRPVTDEERAQFQIPEGVAAAFNIQENRPEILSGRGTTNTFNMPAQVGSIPAGYEMTYDEQGRPVSMQPIPGSPAATEAEATARELKADVERGSQAAGREATTADIVLTDIGRYRDMVKNQGLFTPITGFRGEIMAQFPGTPASDARQLALTIGANIQFDALNQMRKESKTGGALGNVTVQELDALRATLGNIAASQSDEQLLFNLDRLERQYNEIMKEALSYPDADKEKFGISAGSSTRNDPLGLFN